MNEAYAAWIERWVSAQPERYVRGLCQRATTLMIEEFPELRQAAGFVHCAWGRDRHFWCVSPDGEIVDPTRSQFPEPLEYEELDLSDPKTRERIPTGRCMDCGSDVYMGAMFCDSRCEEATRRYLGF